ncbi:MAG: hypothetical protein PF483_11555 [Halothiobacillus sp.]|jgi:hypothetical protein|nr:hypothetical protein [Halothiobacillus sp.]
MISRRTTTEVAKQLKLVKSYAASVDSNFTLAVAFHEVWKPTAYDQDLHQRMGSSYAGQAFLIVRTALRREMLLSLMRIWDTTSGAHSVSKIVATLRDPHTWSTLVDDRTNKLGLQDVVEEVAQHLDTEWKDVLRTYKKYSKGGSHYDAFVRLRNLRHGSLAHTQSPSAGAAGADPTDAEVSQFYEDTGDIAKKVMSIVNATAINYSDTSGVYSHYAKFFWINARGEKTEGHPNYCHREGATELLAKAQPLSPTL